MHTCRCLMLSQRFFFFQAATFQLCNFGNFPIVQFPKSVNRILSAELQLQSAVPPKA